MSMAKEKKKEKKKREGRKTKPYQPKKHCPKCGPGVWLAEHNDRHSCGKCGYYQKK